MKHFKTFHHAGASQHAYLGREQIFLSLDCQKGFRSGFPKSLRMFPKKMSFLRFDLFGFTKPEILI